MTKRILTDNDIISLIDHIRQTDPLKKYCPYTPTPLQWKILNSKASELLVGPGAGAGKTYASLMLALKDINNKHSHSLIIRNTYADLTKAQCQIPESLQWFKGTDAKYNGTEHKWKFPSGATIEFGYLEHEQDKWNYRSAAYTKIIFDEASLLQPESMEFLFSRQRTTKDSGLKLQTYFLTNPGGPAHEWLHNRFIIEKHPNREYFHSTLRDNNHLDQESYLENLAKLTEIEYRQLANGEWILDESKNVYHLTQNNIINNDPPSTDTCIMSIDLGFNDDSAISIIGYNNYETKLHVLFSQKFSKTDVSTIANLATNYNNQYKPITIVIDSAGAGKMITEELFKRYNLPAKPAIKQEKEAYIKLLNADLEHNNILIYSNTCLDLIKEMKSLMRDKHGKENQYAPNHACDSFLYAYKEARAYMEKPKPKYVSKEEKWITDLINNKQQTELNIEDYI